MKRALPLVLSLLAAGAAIAGLYTLGRRHRAAAPVQGPAEAPTFNAAPAGTGFLLSLNTEAAQPMRAVRYLLVQQSGEVLGQALTQTGDQLIGRFQSGQFVGTLHLPLPDGVPAAFFRFARLQDAAQLADGALLLLFTDGTGGSAAPWLVETDSAGQVQWTLKASGSHLAVEAGGASCLLWDGGSLARATWSGEPGLVSLPLPDGVSVVDGISPLDGRNLVLSHPGGLARSVGGAWTTLPLPDPGLLSFPGMAGSLAKAGFDLFWQPRPGQLYRLGRDGGTAAVDLSAWSFPKEREKDAALLRLAGADAKGRLWFTLATPDLTVDAHPSAGDQPSAAVQAVAALSGSSAPAAAPSQPAFDAAAWADYLKGGLDRVYVWDPSGSSPRLLDWKARWPSLGAPADFPMPLARHLHPAQGALLQELDARAWWVPLDRL